MKPPVPQSIREQLGDPVLVHQLASSPRSTVFLVEFDGSPAIVKHITGGSDRGRRYRTEVAALRLAGRVRPRPAAALMATDATARVLVFEYLGGARPATLPWAVQYATALAGLHSATAGEDPGNRTNGDDTEDANRASPEETGDAANRAGREDTASPRYRGPGDDDVRAFRDLALTLGVPFPNSVETELTAAVDRLATSADDALLHGDPCPDNAISTDDGIRFVDLEGAQRGPGVVELAYLRIGFPTCWCVKALPERHIADAENAYRDVRRGVGDVADACVGWLMQGDALVEKARRHDTDHLARVPRRDWRWGTATARERLLHRLGVVAALAEEHERLAATAGLARDMATAMKRKWPGLEAVPTALGDPGT
jgi:hypothetical protein